MSEYFKGDVELGAYTYAIKVSDYTGHMGIQNESQSWMVSTFKLPRNLLKPLLFVLINPHFRSEKQVYDVIGLDGSIETDYSFGFINKMENGPKFETHKGFIEYIDENGDKQKVYWVAYIVIKKILGITYLKEILIQNDKGYGYTVYQYRDLVLAQILRRTKYKQDDVKNLFYGMQWSSKK